jgi:ribA/ribD-fused uncharacterized protein
MGIELQKDVLGNPIIGEFQGEYRFLSNFWLCEIEFEGLPFPSAEHAFVWSKTLDLEEQAAILRCSTPGKVKQLGKTVTLRPDWELIKGVIMIRVLMAKFGQNQDLKELLIATEDAELIEGNHWHDNYWGDCRCEECKDILGRNVLGTMLMMVRGYLKYCPQS